jgi:hypothetical protein
MSPRSIYFRDQADACWRLAILLTDAETQEQLRKLAIELIERAAEIEGKEDAPAPIDKRSGIVNDWPLTQSG